MRSQSGGADHSSGRPQKRRRPSLGASSGASVAGGGSGAGFSPFGQSKRTRIREVEWGGELPDRSFHRWGNYDAFVGYDPTSPRSHSGRFQDDHVLQDPRVASVDPALFAGAAVLDIGCGAGYLCFQMAERLGATRVLGVDIDASLVAKARRLLAYRKAVYASGPASDRPRTGAGMSGGSDGKAAAPLSNSMPGSSPPSGSSAAGQSDSSGTGRQVPEFLPASVRTSQRWLKPPPRMIPAPPEESASAAAAVRRYAASASSSAGAGAGAASFRDDRFVDADDRTAGGSRNASPRDDRFVDADADDSDAAAVVGAGSAAFAGVAAGGGSSSSSSSGGPPYEHSPSGLSALGLFDEDDLNAASGRAVAGHSLLAASSDDGGAAAAAAVAAVFRSDESDSDSDSDSERSGGSRSSSGTSSRSSGRSGGPPRGYDGAREFAAVPGAGAGAYRSSSAAGSSGSTAPVASVIAPGAPAAGVVASSGASRSLNSTGAVAGGAAAPAAPAPAPAPLARLERVHFLCQDFVEGGGGGARGSGAVTIPPASFDIVTLFNVTKYVHLNGGDEAVRSLLSRAYAALRPGGRLLLIAQDWESYGRSRHLCVGFSAQYARIRFKPADFLPFLLEEVGFRRLHAAVRVRKPASRHGTSQLLVLEK